ncbi:MAG TPA: AEC family transporter [Azospirillum sp.]|nr:AEC family transporter [Azospirillum sp.]
MIAVFAALAPIFLLILFGHGLRRGGVVPDAFWPAADRLTYFLFFPCLIVDELSKAKLAARDVLGMGTALEAGVLTAAALMLLGRRWMALGGPAFTSVFQGAMRMNTYVILAAARTLYGPAGLALTAVGIAVAVPTVNVLCVLALARHGSNAQGAGARAIATGLAKNPIILAALAGAVLSLSGIGRPPVVGDIVEILARAALPMGLLSVGAGLDLGAARAAGRGVAIATALKLLVVPAVTGLTGLLIGLDGLPLTIAVLFNAAPCAASAYVLARQMGGDHGLIASIITVQTLLAALSLPIVLVAFG